LIVSAAPAAFSFTALVMFVAALAPCEQRIHPRSISSLGSTKSKFGTGSALKKWHQPVCFSQGISTKHMTQSWSKCRRFKFPENMNNLALIIQMLKPSPWGQWVTKRASMECSPSDSQAVRNIQTKLYNTCLEKTYFGRELRCRRHCWCRGHTLH